MHTYIQDWQRDVRLSELKNLIIDVFGVRHPNSLHMAALQRVVVCSALNETRIQFDHYLLDTAKVLLCVSVYVSVYSIIMCGGMFSSKMGPYYGLTSIVYV